MCAYVRASCVKKSRREKKRKLKLEWLYMSIVCNMWCCRRTTRSRVICRFINASHISLFFSFAHYLWFLSFSSQFFMLLESFFFFARLSHTYSKWSLPRLHVCVYKFENVATAAKKKKRIKKNLVICIGAIAIHAAVRDCYSYNGDDDDDDDGVSVCARLFTWYSVCMRNTKINRYVRVWVNRDLYVLLMCVCRYAKRLTYIQSKIACVWDYMNVIFVENGMRFFWRLIPVEWVKDRKKFKFLSETSTDIMAHRF